MAIDFRLDLRYCFAMRKTFQYRLYPTGSQGSKMAAILEECRWLWNHSLAERKDAWEQRQDRISLFSQQGRLPALKQERESVKRVHSQVLQQVLVRLDLAFQAFFRRCKTGEKPGYPRFRGRGRYNSFTYPQAPSGCKLDGNILTLSKVGKVRVVLHRPIEGKVKTCTIQRTSTGKWFVSFACELEAVAIPASEEQVGIDVGLTTFATLSTGEEIANPRFFRKGEKDLARAHRRLSKTEKGSHARARRRKVVARKHERIANQRRNFAHQQSRRIVNRFGTIAVEDIHVGRMIHTNCLRKSIYDAAWSDFLSLLAYKAAYAGRRFVACNPAYTTQDCSGCGHRQVMPLSKRVFDCPCCGLHLSRDLNASFNILAVGLHSLAKA